MSFSLRSFLQFNIGVIVCFLASASIGAVHGRSSSSAGKEAAPVVALSSSPAADDPTTGASPVPQKSRPNSAVRCASMIHTDAQHVPIIDKPGTRLIPQALGHLFLDPRILQNTHVTLFLRDMSRFFSVTSRFLA